MVSKFEVVIPEGYDTNSSSVCDFEISFYNLEFKCADVIYTFWVGLSQILGVACPKWSGF